MLQISFSSDGIFRDFSELLLSIMESTRGVNLELCTDYDELVGVLKRCRFLFLRLETDGIASRGGANAVSDLERRLELCGTDITFPVISIKRSSKRLHVIWMWKKFVLVKNLFLSDFWFTHMKLFFFFRISLKDPQRTNVPQKILCSVHHNKKLLQDRKRKLGGNEMGHPGISGLFFWNI